MKPILKMALLAVVTPLLVALPFVIRGHQGKMRIKKQVWSQEEPIRESCDILRAKVITRLQQRIISVDPDSPDVPEVLRRLSPIAIEVRDRRVQIGLSAGFSRLGLFCYPPDMKGTGTVEIAPRLWWYED